MGREENFTQVGCNKFLDFKDRKSAILSTKELCTRVTLHKRGNEIRHNESLILRRMRTLDKGGNIAQGGGMNLEETGGVTFSIRLDATLQPTPSL